MTTPVHFDAFTIAATMDSPAARWRGELTSAAVLQALTTDIPVTLSLGMADAGGAEVWTEVLTAGRVDTRGGTHTPDGLIVQCGGRDAMWRLEDTRVRLRFQRFPSPEPIAEDTTAYDPTEVLIGRHTARSVVEELLRRVNAAWPDLPALELVWLTTDYVLMDTFDAHGPVARLILSLLEPWQRPEIEPYRTDLYVVGTQVLIRARDWEPVADLTLSVHDARVESFALEVERLPLLRHVRLEGAPRPAEPGEVPLDPDLTDAAADAARKADEAAALAEEKAHNAEEEAATAEAKAKAAEAKEKAAAVKAAEKAAAEEQRQNEKLAKQREARKKAEEAKQAAHDAAVAAAAAAAVAHASDPPDEDAIAAADASAEAAAESEAAATATAESSAAGGESPLTFTIDPDGTGRYLPGSRTTTEVAYKDGNSVITVTDWQLPEQIIKRQTKTTAAAGGGVVNVEELVNEWTQTVLDENGQPTGAPLPTFSQTTIRIKDETTGLLRVDKVVTIEYTYDGNQFLKGELSTTAAFKKESNTLEQSEMTTKTMEASGALLVKTVTDKYAWDAKKMTWTVVDHDEKTDGGHMAGGPNRGPSTGGLTVLRPVPTTSTVTLTAPYTSGDPTLTVAAGTTGDPPFTVTFEDGTVVLVRDKDEGEEDDVLSIEPLDEDPPDTEEGTELTVTSEATTTEPPSAAIGLIPVVVEFDLPGDATADDLDYQNARLNRDALVVLGDLIARAHGRWQHAIRTSGVPIPGVTRGTRIQFTGLTDMAGAPMPLEVALVVDVNLAARADGNTMDLTLLYWKAAA